MTRSAGGDEPRPSPETDRVAARWPSRVDLTTFIPLGLAVLVLCALFWSGRGRGAAPGFPLDDAWIHMVYGRSLAEEGRLAYNPGTPATGSTSPLWALVLGAVHLLLGRTPIDVIIAAVMGIGCVFHLLGVLSVTRWARAFTGDRVAAVMIGALPALSTSYAAASFSGMEVTLCGWLLVAGVLSCVAGHGWAAGFWLALACLARPEAAAVLALCLCTAPFAARGRTVPERAATAIRLAIPALVLGVLQVLYNQQVSGHPLPATFYFKEERDAVFLPDRLLVAIADVFAGMPPFAGWVGWAAVVGLLPPFARRSSVLPFAAALAFLLANLYVIAPIDPPAFYHQRYLLPAVPLLVAALGLCAWQLGRRLQPGRPHAGLAALLAVGLGGAAVTAKPVSEHLHNDIRNINEVQRALGSWLGEQAPPGAWIAASDAGAVRYFSRRPVVDVMGLNTPEFYWQQEIYLRSHAVTAAVLMPAWFSASGPVAPAILAAKETRNYTVTSNPLMARQVVLANRGTHPATVAFRGVRRFSLVFLPWRAP